MADVIGKFGGDEDTNRFVQSSTKMVNGRMTDEGGKGMDYKMKPSDWRSDKDQERDVTRDKDRNRGRDRDWDRDKDRDRDRNRVRHSNTLEASRKNSKWKSRVGNADPDSFDTQKKQEPSGDFEPVQHGVVPQQTTTLHFAHVPGDLTAEDELAALCGQYGALGGLAIRKTPNNSHEAKVTYMLWEDASAAYSALCTKFSLGWAPPSKVPPYPWYIHLTLRTHDTMLQRYNMPRVNVDTSISPKIRKLIDITARSVVKHGPEFEEALKGREAHNPCFAFMQSPYDTAEHTYYRWRLFSLYQGDNMAQWRTVPFQMFYGGAVWTPPSCGEMRERVGKGVSSENPLSEGDKAAFFDILRQLKPTNESICAAMMFCMQRAAAAAELAAILADALSLKETPSNMKLSRLHLLSDVLHNSASRVHSASLFRIHFQQNLPRIFKGLHATTGTDPLFRSSVMSLLRIWSNWQVYPEDFIASLAMELN
eukprot:TRINITY_DN6453_c0_g1_i3.p1 TRINITY_DN6453_c0_g1~~TRINITY_DN6453_c0_g1_i3.p1  ORF type:complete len:480 (+),score=104.90 TRINITY_DN6453_c0_g1_i3:473-1912(+)